MKLQELFRATDFDQMFDYIVKFHPQSAKSKLATPKRIWDCWNYVVVIKMKHLVGYKRPLTRAMYQ